MVSAIGRKEAREVEPAPEQQGKTENGAEADLQNTVRQWTEQLFNFFSDEDNRPFLDTSKKVLVTRNGQRASEPLTFESGQQLVTELGALAEGCEDREKLLEIKRTFLSLRYAIKKIPPPAEAAPEKGPAGPAPADDSVREKAPSQGQSSEPPPPPEEEEEKDEKKKGKGKKVGRRAERRLKERERASAAAEALTTGQGGRYAEEAAEPTPAQAKKGEPTVPAASGGEEAKEEAATPPASGARREKGTSSARAQGEAWANDERNAAPAAKLREAIALWNASDSGAEAVAEFWGKTDLDFGRLKTADHRIVPFVLLAGGLPRGKGGDLIEALKRGERRRGEKKAREAAEIKISGPLTIEAVEAAVEEADRRFPEWGIRARVAAKKTEAGKVEFGTYWLVALAHIAQGRNISDPQVDKDVRKEAGRLAADYLELKRRERRAAKVAGQPAPVELPAPAGKEPEPAAPAAIPPTSEPVSAPSEPAMSRPRERYQWQSQRRRTQVPSSAPAAEALPVRRGDVLPPGTFGPEPAPAPRVEAPRAAPPAPVAPRVENIQPSPASVPPRAEARPPAPPAAPRVEAAPEMNEAEALEERWKNAGRSLADFRTQFFTNDRREEEVRKKFGARLSELEILFSDIPVGGDGDLTDWRTAARILAVVEGHLPMLSADARDLVA